MKEFEYDVADHLARQNVRMKEFEHDVVDRLARIETKLDGVPKKLDDHETRIRSQEKRSWVVLGLSLAISAIAPNLAGKIGL